MLHTYAWQRVYMQLLFVSFCVSKLDGLWLSCRQILYICTAFVYLFYQSLRKLINTHIWNFPDGPVVKTLPLQSCGQGSILGAGEGS